MVYVILHICWNMHYFLFGAPWPIPSSVTRGGGGGLEPPPIGLWSMQNHTFMVVLRPILCEKLKIAPPLENSPPSNFWISDSGRKISLKIGEDLFFIWRPPVFGRKKRLNFRFRPKNHSQNRWRPFFFFFLETTCFWAEKTFEFPIPAEKSFSKSVKTFFFFFLETTCFWAEKTFEFPSFLRNFVSIFGQTVWNWFKNNENSGQGRLHTSHSFKIAPLFQILATRLPIPMGKITP